MTEANVGYFAEGPDPDASGGADISGNALFRDPHTETSFPISLDINRKSASQAKREADEADSPWPDYLNEITDDVIGILFKAAAKEFELRRGRLYLHPDQFDKLLGNLATSKKIRLYSRQGVQSECDLIVGASVWAKLITPQS